MSNLNDIVVYIHTHVTEDHLLATIENISRSIWPMHQVGYKHEKEYDGIWRVEYRMPQSALPLALQEAAYNVRQQLNTRNMVGSVMLFKNGVMIDYYFTKGFDPTQFYISMITEKLSAVPGDLIQDVMAGVIAWVSREYTAPLSVDNMEKNHGSDT